MLEFVRSESLPGKAIVQVDVVASLVRGDGIEVRGICAGTRAVRFLIDGVGFEDRSGRSGAAVSEEIYLVVGSDANPSDGAFAGFD